MDRTRFNSGRPVVARRAPNSQIINRATARPTVSVQVQPKPVIKPVVAAPVIPVVEAPNIKVSEPAVPKIAATILDMSLAEQAEPPARDREFKLRKPLRQRVRKVAVVGLVMVMLGGGFFASQVVYKTHKIFPGGAGTAAALQPNVKPDLLKGEGSGRVNVLLLGRAGAGNPRPNLTDSMTLASIDPVNHTATLLSLPSDLWVNLPSLGNMKLDAAYQAGGMSNFSSVDQAVSSVTGIDVDYNVIVNYQAFSQAVDTLGGVNVTVTADLNDPTVAWQNSNNPVIAAAGNDAMSGPQALLYARSKETTSDSARAQRQRDVLEAIKAKTDTMSTLTNPAEISSLFSTFASNVQTDLSISNAARLFGILKNVSSTQITSDSLDQGNNPYVTNGTLAGQAITVPTAGLFDYGNIQQYVRTQLKDPYIVKENAPILVLNGTSTPGLATTVSNDLKTYGYNVLGASNTPNPGQTKTEVVELNKNDKYTANYLAKRFNVKVSTHMPNNSIGTNGADFVIILGSDEANSTQN